MKKTLVVIDYGMGNLGSIMNMLKRIGATATLTSDILLAERAEKIILPGVGAFARAMDNLSELGLVPVLETSVLENKVPFLGICLGMQLLSKTSEEGQSQGLGWIDAETKRFPYIDGYKVPHMGWNTVIARKDSKLFSEMYENPRFYFVHSYYVSCNQKNLELTTTQHGISFCSSLEDGNIYGVQYHPEKSHKYGMKLLQNFVELC